MKYLLYLILIQCINILYCMEIQGFYESQFGRSYESDAFKWNIWDPNFYLETRIQGSPNQYSNWIFDPSTITLTYFFVFLLVGAHEY